MERAQLTRLLLVTSILYVIGFYFIGSAIKPGYSQLSNLVSEYNATGTLDNALAVSLILMVSTLIPSGQQARQAVA